MKIEVIKAYKVWPKGHIFTDMPANVAATLIARGFVREVKEPGLVERVLESAPVNRMIRPQVKKTA